MTLREFFLERLKAETPLTTRVLAALPADRLSYKPHDRSPSTEQLVWTLANEFKVCVDVVTTHRGEWLFVPAPPLAEMRTIFERSSATLIDEIAKMDDAAWDRTVPFYYEGKVISEQPIGQFLWFIIFDAIHHRGQLSTYLRPMGGKVPAIYGPSADEPSS
jgi:uncharacterized damage-inducible protein DinB